MSVFRLTNVRETKEFWDKRVEDGWETPYHSLYTGDHIERMARFDAINLDIILPIVRRCELDGKKPRVLECACGYGRYAQRLGYELLDTGDGYVGIDFADKNIAEARRICTMPNATFHVADMATFDDGGKFDLIFMVAAWSSIEQRSAEIMAHLKTLLRPGGIIAVFESGLYFVVWGSL